MHIGIDARAYGWAGLGRYTRNLLAHLTTLPECPQLTVFVPHRYGRDLSTMPHVRVVPVNGSYYSLHEQTLFLTQLLRERVELMHFLHFNAPVLYRRPSVVTIHDLTRFLFPAQKKRGAFHQWAYEEVFRSAIVHARHVITVSKHTRNDLIRFFPHVAERTSVIPEGIEHEHYVSTDRRGADRQILADMGVSAPYLLFVGVWMNHKNLSRLLAAFRLLVDGGFPGTLVITGVGRAHDENVPAMVRALRLSGRVVMPGIVSEDILPSLYRGADVFVFPSLYEGFGFPPLEAMACGVPVVSSYVACLPEILGDAAHYVDPLSPEDIAHGVRRVLTDTAYREELVARARVHVTRYQWKTCVRETLRVYTTILKEERSLVPPRFAHLGSFRHP